MTPWWSRNIKTWRRSSVSTQQYVGSKLPIICLIGNGYPPNGKGVKGSPIRGGQTIPNIGEWIDPGTYRFMKHARSKSTAAFGHFSQSGCMVQPCFMD